MIRTFARRFSAIIPIAIACFLAGCGSSNSSGTNASGAAYIKTINASLDAASSTPSSFGTPFLVNLKIGNTAAATNLQYGEATSTYAGVAAGANQNIQISASSLAGNPAPKTIQSSLLKNQYYTIISTASGSNLGAMVLQDDLTPPTSGNVKIRLIHEAVTAGPVDIYITPPNTVIDDPKHPVTPTLSNFAVGAVSPYIQIPAGSYDFLVTPPGKPSDILSYTSITSPLAAGNIYTAVFLDPHGYCYPGRACPNLVAGYSMDLTQDQPVTGVTP